MCCIDRLRSPPKAELHTLFRQIQPSPRAVQDALTVIAVGRNYAIGTLLSPIGDACAPVCGELVFKPQQAGDTGLGDDCASGRNADLQPLIVSSRFLQWACRRPTRNGTAGTAKLTDIPP